MAKKQTTRKTANKNKTKDSNVNIKSVFSPEGGWKELLCGEKLKFILGLITFALALYMLLCFTSFFYTASVDQTQLENNIGNQLFVNYGGKLGAYIANYFFNEAFGVCSYFLPIFMIGLSLKFMDTYGIRLRKWFVNCSVLMIWGSVVLTLLSSKEFLNVFPAKLMKIPFQPDWGGGHGHLVSQYLTNNIGLIGTVILMIVTGILYLIYFSGQTIEFIRILFNPSKYRAEHSVTNGTEEESDKGSKEDDEDYTEELNDEDSNDELEELHSEEDIISNSEDDAKDLLNLTEENLTDEENSDAATTIDLGDSETEVAPNDIIPSLTVSSTVETDINEELEITKADEPEKGASTKTVASPLEVLGPYDPRKDLEHYKFPTLSLLKKYENEGPSIDMEEQKSNKDRIVTVLHDFGVEITNIKATIGPTITLYEVTPAPGIRISKIRNLGDDIALNLSAEGVRIIAPMPGKGTIGIEVPNRNKKIVSMESILNTKKFKEANFALPIALGKTITNDVYMVDLAKMPHLLVAGATGQGKSVGLNAIVTSLLYKKHPAELKFVIIDPKKVEFSIYAPIEKHFLAKVPDNEEPIITDVRKVIETLKSLCVVMDHRYDLLKKARVRNIKEYNEKFINRELNPANGHEFMPYIVIIIDEFGDLIMTAGKEVELPIARIAQLARAVGMHMIIATQRPTTNIITGTIKANFPARMAFKVSSGIDSKTILDRTGAQQLIGRGDMLFLSGNEPVRVQCAFVDTPEVERINEFITTQQGYISAFKLPEVAEESDGDGAGSRDDSGQRDSMFEEVARYIVMNQAGSTSLIQRKFSIGYNRAGRLMDQLENAGIVGPARGAKPREVLVQDEFQLDQMLGI
ncbi:FtsK/SpoIIIE family DNA translocase [Alloprevotella rava]|uniref:S-DNA-T family DNA segregation ATPase FtsK/SpoIIIE n=1 Tax=Alloprevotella rava TaxID=671218 RepID=A0A7W5UIL5_9BACT|nr:DNA translocase FtsK [Alloprevotella rava]MBB3703201.1 S-DNA-T family DNA segregation ATPase FtsK/SpoIIIE [Alloprevotella rava]